MAIYDYGKYQILLYADSKKTQGLQTGDIVRRQYFDGTNTIYSLMCVVGYGTERALNDDTGLYEDRQYFIGALLEGDAPQQGELLDFARITNLFNVDRSGALYLTASDDMAPFMDVIDSIGRNESLSWPENVAADFEDSTAQYIVKGTANLNAQYSPSYQEYSRILTVTRMSAKTEDFEGLQQDFYQFVQNPNRVLVSYRVRASQAMEAAASLGYIDDLRMDGQWTESISTEWEYKFKVITVDYSGRHLRSFKLSMENLAVGQEIQIADFNIILLSSVANFADGKAMRIGKLDGIVDPVFGSLDGYGAYLQKLYAAHAAHISGTLTAGDENGFGATFYAGKIHANCFINSLDISFTTGITIDDGTLVNPTGMGRVYKAAAEIEMTAQTGEWLAAHQGQRYCYSFWVYAKRPCQLGVAQNGNTVGTIHITAAQTHEWRRVNVKFDLLPGEADTDDLLMKVIPTFGSSVFDVTSTSEANPDESVFFFTAPQLESGELVTQYQPTDDQLNYTDDYGAWMARGGIGGTIQNPLLQLNYDGNGSIGTRSKSIELKQDGSGHLANENIKWDENGKVTFGKDVTLDWDNLGSDAQDNMANRYMRIVGEDTFTIIGQETADGKTYSPVSITLSLEEVGFSSTSSQRQWYYKYGGEFVAIEDGNAPTLTVTPESSYWNNESSVTFQCIITLNSERTYADTFTVKKQYVNGYEIKVTSKKGVAFQNGVCSTTLTATVYYQGKLVDNDYALANFVFIWHRYKSGDMTTELEIDGTIDSATPNVLTLDYELDGSDTFVCELATADHFDYSFPIIF